MRVLRGLFWVLVLGMSMLHVGCKPKEKTVESQQPEALPWKVDQFADIKILRYEVPEWDSLTPKQRVLCFYLSQAALAGRDILWDQNCEYNLAVRAVLEGIYRGYKGAREGEDWDAFVVYLKRVWFSNGIHHHYGQDKIEPGFELAYFMDLMRNTPEEFMPETMRMPMDTLALRVAPILFDSAIASKRVNRTLGEDVLLSSSMNYYKGVTQKEAETFYTKMREEGDTKLSYGMNSQLVKKEGQLKELVWSAQGMYGEAIREVVKWLKLAHTVAETPAQEKTIELLISYYETGDLATFNDYCIAWVQDTVSRVDFVNGFIEDYGDPLGIKCSWEAVVNVRNEEATQRTKLISANADWFEKHSPIAEEYKKTEVTGVEAKVISAVALGGDCHPSAPIGINLPNANWIRAEHGSKSVTIENLTYAYDKAAEGNGFLEEFAADEDEVKRAREYGFLADNLHTDLHECLGHGSGKLAPGKTGNELLNYSATLEEVRADLFALYYIMDAKLVELGILPEEGEYAKACYDGYMRNGLLTQLSRIDLGKKIEQDHMRCRSLIAHWCYEKGREENVVDMVLRDGKHYVKVNNYEQLRELFADLLYEVQRIKSEGDFVAGKNLVETYAVNIDYELHKEVKERYASLNTVPYGGFLNPMITAVTEVDSVVDARLEYPTDYVEQMLYYSEQYSFLPVRFDVNTVPEK